MSQQYYYSSHVLWDLLVYHPRISDKSSKQSGFLTQVKSLSKYVDDLLSQLLYYIRSDENY